MMRVKIGTISIVTATLLAPTLLWAQGPAVSAAPTTSISAEAQKCIQNLQFSDVSYDELRTKLETTLREKNKSLIFMDFRSLQAQVDVMVSHLMVEEAYNPIDSRELLFKIKNHLNLFETLLIKAKINAKLIKEEHVVPLATMTSMKSESDRCQGINSQFTDIFRILSKLNKDLNEILMMSPQRIHAQKDMIDNLIKKTEEQKVGLTAKNMSESLNFIQNQINNVTHTFEFDAKTLGVAKN